MYKTAYPQNREKSKGILLAGLTSFFSGITEPIRFSYLYFAAFMGLPCIYGGYVFPDQHLPWCLHR